MHVHVAQLDTALQTFLKSVAVDAPDWKYANCTGWQSLRCAATNKATGVAAVCKSVNAGRGPSDAVPFESVYGTYNSTATMLATTAVYSPRDNVFCVLRATDRPVGRRPAAACPAAVWAAQAASFPSVCWVDGVLAAPVAG